MFLLLKWDHSDASSSSLSPFTPKCAINSYWTSTPPLSLSLFLRSASLFLSLITDHSSLSFSIIRHQGECSRVFPVSFHLSFLKLRPLSVLSSPSPLSSLSPTSVYKQLQSLFEPILFHTYSLSQPIGNHDSTLNLHPPPLSLSSFHQQFNFSSFIYFH